MTKRLRNRSATPVSKRKKKRKTVKRALPSFSLQTLFDICVWWNAFPLNASSLTIDNRIPVFDRRIKDKVYYSSMYDCYVTPKKTINKGAFGEIVSATLRDEHKQTSEIIVKKLLNFDLKEFTDELKMQIKLYCFCTDVWTRSTAPSFALQVTDKIRIVHRNTSTIVPKVLFVAKDNVFSRNDYFMCMERYQFDGDDYVEKWKGNTANVANMLVHICMNLKMLQDNLRFMHRDFHLGNVMCRELEEVSAKPRTVGYFFPVRRSTEWCIIDFGMARTVTYCMSRKRRQKCVFQLGEMYGNEKIYNRGHDMRILFFSLLYHWKYLSEEMLKYVLLKCFSAVKYIELHENDVNIEDEINTPLSHYFYETVVHKKAPEFYPERIVYELLHLDQYQRLPEIKQQVFPNASQKRVYDALWFTAFSRLSKQETGINNLYK